MLLQTKFFFPLHKPNQVFRPRLIKLLNQALQLSHRLILISAPAGFGKTTLVGHWVESLQTAVASDGRPGNRIAWLSLDERDNDPGRFLAYLITALRQMKVIETRIGQGALAMLQWPQPPPIEDILTSLINDVTAVPHSMVLVLDDYHLIESAPVDKAIAFLLEHLPPQMHLVIATRVDPHLPVARFRARSQLTELRAVDLRFTSAEAAEFLNQVMGLNLSSADIAALAARTEGWIAGVQLAAISMQGRPHAADFINSFAGSHHFVLDYLVEDVLEQQPEHLQAFLLQTAVLDQLTGPLCDALTNQGNGQEMLEALERANLFVVPLDEERCWFRYHHLFAELLRQRLRISQPDRAPLLHHRASAWHEQNGFVDAAVEHALQAEEFKRAADLIEATAEEVHQRGEYARVRRWLKRLPPELVAARPMLALYHAEAQLVTGHQDAAESSLQALEQTLDSGSEPASGSDQDLSKMRGRMAVTRSLLAFYRGDIPAIIRHARQALAIIPKEDPVWRSSAEHAIGDAHIIKGDMNAAYLAHVEALEATKAAGNVYMILIANMKLAITLRHQGRLLQALEICRQQLKFAADSGLSQSMIVGWLLAVWGELLAERNDLDGAIQQAEKGVELTRRGGSAGDVAMRAWSLLCLVRVLFSQQDFVGASAIIQEMATLERDAHVPPWIAAMMAPWQARVWLAEGRLEAAVHWAAEHHLQADDELIFPREIEHMVQARILTAQGRIAEAIPLLQRLLAAATAGGRSSREIEIWLIQALAYQASGKKNRALTTLEHALNLAEPLGFVRIFLDEGPPIVPLLQAALKRRIVASYVRRLLAAFSAEIGSVPPKSDHSELIEALSEREVEVLRYIAEGLTNREIAERLYLSLNTVKVHTRNIYSKLGVHNRTQSVARARDLSILPAT